MSTIVAFLNCINHEQQTRLVIASIQYEYVNIEGKEQIQFFEAGTFAISPLSILFCLWKYGFMSIYITLTTNQNRLKPGGNMYKYIYVNITINKNALI